MPPRRRPKRGLLDGVDEALEPVVRWGAFVSGVALMLLAAGIVVIAFVGDEPGLLFLVPIVILMGWGSTLSWRRRR